MKKFKLLTVYARREPTTDRVMKKYAPRTQATDVQIYRDRAATKPFGRFMCGQRKPTKRSKTVTLNCYRWRLVWLGDKKK